MSPSSRWDAARRMAAVAMAAGLLVSSVPAVTAAGRGPALRLAPHQPVQAGGTIGADKGNGARPRDGRGAAGANLAGLAHQPVAGVAGPDDLQLSKVCDPTDLAKDQVTTCTITVTNPGIADAPFSISDKVPPELKLVKSSVTGGTTKGKSEMVASGVVMGSQAAGLHAATCTACVPFGGYQPLELFGTPPIVGVDDETLTNFTVPAFTYAGATWTSIGVASNGYAVVGGGTGADLQAVNQVFPDGASPNNVLAPFWTDLQPGAAGTIRIAGVSDGTDTWLVIDWEAMEEHSTPSRQHTFEIWIGLDGDAHPGEDITFAYGPNTGDGEGGLATVGAENSFGDQGANVYANGVGTLPVEGTGVRVATTLGVPGTYSLTYQAKAGPPGKHGATKSWTDCATLTSSAFAGTSSACVTGTIH
jgi:hypothetical protein